MSKMNQNGGQIPTHPAGNVKLPKTMSKPSSKNGTQKGNKPSTFGKK
jgi:hypothetical protein